ncbi:MAG: SH3 domain-containing protein [Clostridia bacterium]|nr:SH3 domain-containing protein [Clostridia bacterium]
MADCYGCPYRWHDSDCEYCGAQGDMILDLKSIKKENCPYYKEYMAAKGKSSSSSSSSYSSSSTSSSSYSSSTSSSSSSGGSGCGVAIIVILIIAALIGGGAFLIPKFFGGRSETGVAQQATAVVYNVNYSLNMRDAASSDSNVITTIPKGETVQIIEMGAEWHYVQYGEHQGYCAAECLQIQ